MHTAEYAMALINAERVKLQPVDVQTIGNAVQGILPETGWYSLQWRPLIAISDIKRRAATQFR
jgi:hypothetical protein